jgi:biopolymer transport protein ExbD
VKKHSMPEMKEGGVNVTPLIDVVMCLIVFFMLVAKIGVKTGATKLDLPETQIGKKIDELGDNIILNVTDPNIDREADGSTPKYKIDDTTGKPLLENGKPVPLKIPNSNIREPRVTAKFKEEDADAIEVPIIRRMVGGGNSSYPLREALKMAVEQRKSKGLDAAFSVTIRAERGLDYGMLQQVLVECANAGVKKLNYAALGKKGS